MRYLLNDENMVNITLQLILAGIRVIGHGSEKEKLRASLKQIVELFMGRQNFQELRQIAQSIIYLEENQIDFVISKDYYEAKSKNDFSYKRVEQEDDAPAEND